MRWLRGIGGCLLVLAEFCLGLVQCILLELTGSIPLTLTLTLGSIAVVPVLALAGILWLILALAGILWLILAG